MLNKEEIIKKCKKVSIDYVIGHGSALVMHGVKEKTRDIDASTSIDVFRQLEGKIKNGIMIENYCVEGFDIHVIMNYEDYEYEIIEGLKVATLSQTIRDKKSLGRPKDFEQIKMIKKHLMKF